MTEETHAPSLWTGDEDDAPEERAPRDRDATREPDERGSMRGGGSRRVAGAQAAHVGGGQAEGVRGPKQPRADAAEAGRAGAGAARGDDDGATAARAGGEPTSTAAAAPGPGPRRGTIFRRPDEDDQVAEATETAAGAASAGAAREPRGSGIDRDGDAGPDAAGSATADRPGEAAWSAADPSPSDPRGASDPSAPAPGRSVDARLARVHLRGGLITLARAELETMAGLGTLDREALADLAEARWRSGDLVGGGEAARAHLDSGGTEPLAMVVAAEALAAEGRLVESRQLATRVAQRAPGLVARLFAGQSRSLSWSGLDGDRDRDEGVPTWGVLSGGREVIAPGRRLRRSPAGEALASGQPVETHLAPRGAGTVTGVGEGREHRDPVSDRGRDADEGTRLFEAPGGGVRGRPGAAEGARRDAGDSERDEAGRREADRRETLDADRSHDPAGGTATPSSPTAPPRSSTEEAVRAGRAAGRELGAIEDAIDRGDVGSVAARLGLVLRMDRALAPVILSLADRAVAPLAADDPDAAGLHLVRGDAYRSLGREAEATAAYARSRLALEAGADGDDEPRDALGGPAGHDEAHGSDHTDDPDDPDSDEEPR